MQPLIIANWKMNPITPAKAGQNIRLMARGLREIKGAEVVVCPPFIFLPCLFASLLNSQPRGGYVKLGGQNCFWEEKGAFTGEVSPAHLKKFGCKYVILGHSERRTYFNETDKEINKKIKKSLEFELNPVLCVGESLKEKKERKTAIVLRKQIEGALGNIPIKEIKKIVIAYEPTWAIGAGKACPIQEALNANLLIRNIFLKLRGKKSFDVPRILYGGSVNSKNAFSYIKEASFSGLLVGGASLKPKEFINIVKGAAAVVE